MKKKTKKKHTRWRLYTTIDSIDIHKTTTNSSEWDTEELGGRWAVDERDPDSVSLSLLSSLETKSSDTGRGREDPVSNWSSFFCRRFVATTTHKSWANNQQKEARMLLFPNWKGNKYSSIIHHISLSIPSSRKTRSILSLNTTSCIPRSRICCCVTHLVKSLKRSTRSSRVRWRTERKSRDCIGENRATSFSRCARFIHRAYIALIQEMRWKADSAQQFSLRDGVMTENKNGLDCPGIGSLGTITRVWPTYKIIKAVTVNRHKYVWEKANKENNRSNNKKKRVIYLYTTHVVLEHRNTNKEEDTRKEENSIPRSYQPMKNKTHRFPRIEELQRSKRHGLKILKKQTTSSSSPRFVLMLSSR